ncbi:hypothetical protein CDAR_231821 [Caerostris darwini]|uniref:Uncharacterized protein n=1 Tax=Caerostris darwini TaxID=1538125 RepID=A0AAV4TV99_9ARAC|nr:hypothetical protein CDAR_231821 [Caerostris darwini]
MEVELLRPSWVTITKNAFPRPPFTCRLRKCNMKLWLSFCPPFPHTHVNIFRRRSGADQLFTLLLLFYGQMPLEYNGDGQLPQIAEFLGQLRWNHTKGKGGLS